MVERAVFDLSEWHFLSEKELSSEKKGCLIKVRYY